ncbi:MAM and LDL-receptor class A domain-containing 1-like, partial [Paramuricea clavata]
FYLFIETSSPRQFGDNATILTPYLNGPQCMIFSYHMYGSAIGYLNIYANEQMIFSKSGNQGNQWVGVKTPILQSGKYMVKFEGVRGHSYEGDIAIDAISFTPGNCSFQTPKPSTPRPTTLPTGTTNPTTRAVVLLVIGFSNPLSMAVVEGSNVVLTIEVTGQLTTQISATATVSPASASDADFNVLSSTELSFRPGVTKDTIAIATEDDSITEDEEVFVVTLSTTNPSVQIDKAKGVTTVTIKDNDALHPTSSDSTSSSNSNTWVLIGAVAASVVVIVTSIFIAVCCFRQRNRRSRENARDIGKIENPAYEGCGQRSLQPPQLCDSENHYEQPTVYPPLTSSANVTIDAHYQSLHLDEDCYERVDF